MFKKVLSYALICLTVLPVNTYAQSVNIDALVQESQSEAKETVAQKIRENQKLMAELTELQIQIKEIKASANQKRGDMDRDLIIATGTTIATTIAVLYLGRRGQSEVGGDINAGLKAATMVLGSIYTIKHLGSGGYNYLLLQLDEEKMASLEVNLAALKAELETQTAALLK